MAEEEGVPAVPRKGGLPQGGEETCKVPCLLQGAGHLPPSPPPLSEEREK